MTTILIADDDYALRQLVRFYLTREGYHYLEAEDGDIAMNLMKEQNIHLAIIDLMLPKMDGYQLCQEIKSHYGTPVLILTAKHSLTSRERSYASDADDYLTKPFEPKELLFKITSLLQGFSITGEDVITIGDTVINKKSYEVICKGNTLILPSKEFELLHHLASLPGQIFSREHLIASIWGSDLHRAVPSVEVLVQHLRERLRYRTDDFEIQMINGLGYQLEIKV